MLSQRTITLIFACVAALSAGTNYSFSSFGPQLASKLHLSSTVTNTVALFGNAGVYLTGPFLGVLADRKGPRPLLIFGSVCLFVGYLGLLNMYEGGPEGSFRLFGVSGLALAEVLTGVGSSAALCAAVNGVSKAFSPKRRGSAMAAVVAGFGLSAFAYASLSHASFLPGSDATAQYLLLLGLGCGFSQLLAAVFVKPTLHLPSAGSRSGYRSLTTAADDVEDDPYASPLPSRTSSPMPSARPRAAASPRVEEGDPFAHEGLDGRQSPGSGRSGSKERGEGVGKAEVNVTGWALLRERDFWTMWLELGLCSGIGLLYINNVGTVARTLAPLGADPRSITRTQANLVSLLSLSNCAGRLAAGFTGDWLAHHAPLHMRISRVWLLVPMTLTFILSQVLARSATGLDGWRGLTPPTILTGISYGWLFAVSPVLCLDRFGITSFSFNNGVLTLAPAFWGNLANIAFGRIYDSHVDIPELLARGGGSVDHLCTLGPECYRGAFSLTIAMAVGALGVAVVLGFRKTMH